MDKMNDAIALEVAIAFERSVGVGIVVGVAVGMGLGPGRCGSSVVSGLVEVAGGVGGGGRSKGSEGANACVGTADMSVG